MRKFRIPYIPYRSLLLSTTVLNDNIKMISRVCHADNSVVSAWIDVGFSQRDSYVLWHQYTYF